MEILEKRVVSTCELQSGTEMVADAGAVGAVCSAGVPDALSRALAPSVEHQGVCADAPTSSSTSEAPISEVHLNGARIKLPAMRIKLPQSGAIANAQLADAP